MYTVFAVHLFLKTILFSKYVHFLTDLVALLRQLELLYTNVNTGVQVFIFLHFSQWKQQETHPWSVWTWLERLQHLYYGAWAKYNHPPAACSVPSFSRKSIPNFFWQTRWRSEQVLCLMVDRDNTVSLRIFNYFNTISTAILCLNAYTPCTYIYIRGVWKVNYIAK